MTERKFAWLVLIFIALLSGCEGARILGIVPMPAESNHIVFLSLMHELASRQHELTVMNFFPQEKSMPNNINYTDIPLSLWLPDDDGSREDQLKALNKHTRQHRDRDQQVHAFEIMDQPDISAFRMKESYGWNMFTNIPIPLIGRHMNLWRWGNLMSDHLLQTSHVQEVIHSKNQHFDLVILDADIYEAFLGFAHKFKAPVILLCPFGGANWMHNMVGNPSTFSYIPDTFLNYNDHMTLPQRVYNTLVGVMAILGRELYYLPQQDAIMRKYFNNSGPIPYIRELERQTSLLLLNSDVGLGYPRPMVPNAVQVGGMHIKPPKRLLPQVLQNYLDDNRHGVIYSDLCGNYLPDEKRKSLLELFSKIKQKVLWKCEGQFANLEIPRSDILAHPKIKLFITYGDFLSTMEAVYYGVPILGIPVCKHQIPNLMRAELSGYGIRLDFFNLTSESLEWGINTILNDPSYRKNAKRSSKMFRDQPESPMERAVYWVEYVIRHKGAPHLHSAALDLYWFQYFLLDVILVILGVVVISVMLTYFCTKALFRMLTETSKKKRTTLNTKKDN